jgi:hypothetical protein
MAPLSVFPPNVHDHRSHSRIKKVAALTRLHHFVRIGRAEETHRRKRNQTARLDHLLRDGSYSRLRIAGSQSEQSND